MQGLDLDKAANLTPPARGSAPGRAVKLQFAGVIVATPAYTRPPRTHRDALAMVRLHQRKREAQTKTRQILLAPWRRSDYAIAQRLAALRHLLQRVMAAMDEAWRAWPIGREAPPELPTVLACLPYFPAAP